jgi:phage baseplate assembly protein W
MSDGRHLKFPFHVAQDGRSAAPASLEQHVRDEIMQLLLTNQGERPFLPDFGGGLRRLVFERNDDVAAGLSKAVITQAISEWLGHRVKIEALQVTNDDATLAVDLTYRILVTDEVQRVRFERGE